MVEGTPENLAPFPESHRPACPDRPDARTGPEQPSAKVRVLAVDDESIVLRGLRLMLELEPDLCVCGDAEDVSDARRKIARLEPDLVIVDLVLGDSDGFQLMDWIRENHPQIKVIVFTSQCGRSYLERSFQHGARGYVLKDEGTRELVYAIRQVHANKQFRSSMIA